MDSVMSVRITAQQAEALAAAAAEQDRSRGAVVRALVDALVRVRADRHDERTE
jgi:hypothetical protein